MSKIRWAFLLSGYGESALACFNLYKEKLSKSHEFVILVTDGQNTPVEDACRNLNMKIITKSAKSQESIDDYQRQLIVQFKQLDIDYIFLLNYHYRIRTALLEAYQNRIINVHPSLLPSFKNTRTAIQDAIDYGVKISGITTHIIDEEIDGGLIIFQKPVSFDWGDTFETIIQKYRNISPSVFLNTFNIVAECHNPTNFLEKLANAK